MDECIHGLGPVSACVICNGRERTLERDRNVIEYTFAARFDSTCARCAAAIEVGDAIGRTVDGRYVCGDCVVKP